MKPAFRLDQHPRRAQPLSDPPAGYFDQLPTRLMARVAAPPARFAPLGWLWQVSAAWRTSLASALLLTVFGAAFWLSEEPGPVAQPAASAPLTSLDAVPRAQLVAYLLAPETPVETADLAATAQRLGLTRQFMRPSARELTEALDEQPAEESAML